MREAGAADDWGALVGAVEQLRATLARGAMRAGPGTHRRRRRGRSRHFVGVRPYAPGDDLRDVDWAATARTDRPQVRLYEPEEVRDLAVLCDASPSMRHPVADAKARHVRDLATAFAHLALTRGDRVWLAIDGPAEVFRGGHASRAVFDRLDVFSDPDRGLAPLDGLVRAAGGLRRAGGADRSALVVLSDLLMPLADVERWCRALQAISRRAVLIRIVGATETELYAACGSAGESGEEGELVVARDAETGEIREIALDAVNRARFRANVDDHRVALDHIAARFGFDLLEFAAPPDAVGIEPTVEFLRHRAADLVGSGFLRLEGIAGLRRGRS